MKIKPINPKKEVEKKIENLEKKEVLKDFIKSESEQIAGPGRPEEKKPLPEKIEIETDVIQKILSQNEKLKAFRLETLFDIKQLVASVDNIILMIDPKNPMKILTAVMSGKVNLSDELATIEAFAEKYNAVRELKELPPIPAKEEVKEVSINS